MNVREAVIELSTSLIGIMVQFAPVVGRQGA
jgi:hypothetical protein